MVQEVRQQHRVIRPAEVDLKGAARQQVIAVRNAYLARVGDCHLQHLRPVQPGHAGLRILLGNLDAEQPVTRGNVQHAHRAGVSL